MLYSLYKVYAYAEERTASLCGQTKLLLQQINSLCKKEDLCASDIMPALGNGIRLLNSTVETAQQVLDLSNIPSALDTTKDQIVAAKKTTQNIYDRTSDLWNNKIDQTTYINSIAPTFPSASSFVRSLFSTAVSSFGPQLSTHSLFDENHGLMIGINGNSQSLYNVHSGISLFANNYSMKTVSGTNTGFIGGGNVSLSAYQSYSNHGTMESGNLAVSAPKLHLQDGSHINTNTALIDAQSIQGEKGNTITTTDGATIKTDHIDNGGTINGPATLEFNGQANQLESIGTIDQLTYKGTLENDTADKLANGHNDLLNVNNGGSVRIIAQEQDVHLKEKHALSHAFSVLTEKTIKCDQDLSSEKSLWLQAKGDVDHKSVKSKGLTGVIGKNISSKSHVTREYDGENYTESCEKNQVQGAQIVLMAEQDIDYQSTLVQSGLGGTHVSFGNKLIAGDTTVEKYQKTETHKTGTFRKKGRKYHDNRRYNDHINPNHILF